MVTFVQQSTPNSVMGVSMMILFPLTFISNVFVDPRTMPRWLEAFVIRHFYGHGLLVDGGVGAVVRFLPARRGGDRPALRP